MRGDGRQETTLSSCLAAAITATNVSAFSCEQLPRGGIGLAKAYHYRVVALLGDWLPALALEMAPKSWSFWHCSIVRSSRFGADACKRLYSGVTHAPMLITSGPWAYEPDGALASNEDAITTNILLMQVCSTVQQRMENCCMSRSLLRQAMT